MNVTIDRPETEIVTVVMIDETNIVATKLDWQHFQILDFHLEVISQLTEIDHLAVSFTPTFEELRRKKKARELHTALRIQFYGIDSAK